MKSWGFCTNVLVGNDGHNPQQKRLRKSPNDNLMITSLGYNQSTMETYWQPGRIVQIEYEDVSLSAKRVTHPEDVIVTGKPVIYDQLCSHQELFEIIQPFLYPSVRDLYPSLIHANKSYVRDGVVLPRSVGYVECTEVSFPDTNTIRLTDTVGQVYNAALKDEPLKGKLSRDEALSLSIPDRLIVRCALASPWCGEFMDELRCYMMVSWVSVE